MWLQLYMRPLQHDYEGLVESYYMHGMFNNIDTLFTLSLKLFHLLETEANKPQQEQQFGRVFLSLVWYRRIGCCRTAVYSDARALVSW
jgi:hypothetical protein